jgi:hypothetical protein
MRYYRHFRLTARIRTRSPHVHQLHDPRAAQVSGVPWTAAMEPAIHPRTKHERIVDHTIHDAPSKQRYRAVAVDDLHERGQDHANVRAHAQQPDAGRWHDVRPPPWPALV